MPPGGTVQPLVTQSCLLPLLVAGEGHPALCLNFGVTRVLFPRYPNISFVIS